MNNNVTNSTTTLDLFNLENAGRNYHSAFRGVTLTTSFIIAILSPVAVVTNALVLAAIWRNPSLRTPSYILLAGLAFTDFCTGFITQPIYVATKVILLIEHPLTTVEDTTSYIILKALSGFAPFFGNITILIMAFMSIERWLHITRRSLITVRRACFIFMSFLFVSIPVVYYRVLYNVHGTHKLESDILSISFVVASLSVTSVSYFKVFQIIRRHQQQIHANALPQNFAAQPAINFVKYKKSVYTILYILAVYYTAFIPVLIVMVVQVVLNDQSLTDILLDGSIVFIFLGSSLNPLLYLWRMKDIRNEVKQLVKRLLR